MKLDQKKNTATQHKNKDVYAKRKPGTRIDLSKEKWRWMSERKMDSLDALFHEVSVNIIGTTAISLNRITLLAVVGGNEVTNPFMVTEVYIRQNDAWTLASLSFARLLTS